MAIDFPNSPITNATYNVNGQSWRYNGTGWVRITQSAVVSNTVVTDIATQFDGSRSHFALRLEQSAINSLVDSRDLQVAINGALLKPYVTEYTWPWLPVVDSFNGFRVRTFNLANYITIYNAPSPGDSALLTFGQTSTTTQKRRYPFSASTIAFGD
jgi:hypothetical protein